MKFIILIIDVSWFVITLSLSKTILMWRREILRWPPCKQGGNNHE